MKITFKNNSVLDVETFGTDIHDNLIIELKTEDYASVKSIIFNSECTSEITDGEKTYLDYTNVKAFGSSVDNDGNTRIKAILTYGKDVSATISELGNFVTDENIETKEWHNINSCYISK